MRQPAQAIPPHRHTLRENRQSLPLNAMHRSSKALDQNCQHGLVFQSVRFEPKTFRPRQPDGNGGWFWDLQGLDDKLVLYRLQEITEAVSLGHTIYILEGEKDVLTAVEIGLDATCCQGGSSGWRSIYNETFRGADVVITPDNDAAGRKFAETVA